MEVESYSENFASSDEFEPKAEHLDQIKSAIRDYRAKKVLRSDGEYSDGEALFSLSVAINDLKHLRREFAPDGPERRSHSRAKLQELSDELSTLEASALRVASLIGEPAYAALSETSCRWLLAATRHDDEGSEDPLKWLEPGRFLLTGATNWAAAARRVADAATVGLAIDGAEPGSPDYIFARRCLEIWLRLDGGPERTRLPPIKALEEWLALSFRAAQEDTRLSLHNTAVRLREDLRIGFRGR